MYRNSSSTLSKLADTTSIIANLRRVTKSSCLRKSITWAGSDINTHNSTSGITKSNKSTKSISKFKTGGIVATAVQPNKRTRKHQSNRRPSLPMMKHPDTDTELSNVKDFVKKVKSRFKKKKTKGGGGNSGSVKPN